MTPRIQQWLILSLIVVVAGMLAVDQIGGSIEQMADDLAQSISSAASLD